MGVRFSNEVFPPPYLTYDVELSKVNSSYSLYVTIKTSQMESKKIVFNSYRLIRIHIISLCIEKWRLGGNYFDSNRNEVCFLGSRMSDIDEAAKIPEQCSQRVEKQGVLRPVEMNERL